MTKTTHTPGPWHTARLTNTSRMPEIRAGEISIADLRWNGHNEIHGEANSRLIAAAPDLLAALKDLLEADNNDALNDPDDDDYSSALDRKCKALDAASAAIAKATSE